MSEIETNKVDLEISTGRGIRVLMTSKKSDSEWQNEDRHAHLLLGEVLGGRGLKSPFFSAEVAATFGKLLGLAGSEVSCGPSQYVA